MALHGPGGSTCLFDLNGPSLLPAIYNSLFLLLTGCDCLEPRFTEAGRSRLNVKVSCLIARKPKAPTFLRLR